MAIEVSERAVAKREMGTHGHCFASIRNQRNRERSEGG